MTSKVQDHSRISNINIDCAFRYYNTLKTENRQRQQRNVKRCVLALTVRQLDRKQHRVNTGWARKCIGFITLGNNFIVI